jgi:hypothetical protein
MEQIKNNQSSAEWLQWALEHTILTHEQTMQTIGLFEQAKAMHKEEIIDSFGVGCQVEASRLIGYHEMAEQYYNETYKSE